VLSKPTDEKITTDGTFSEVTKKAFRSLLSKQGLTNMAVSFSEK